MLRIVCVLFLISVGNVTAFGAARGAPLGANLDRPPPFVLQAFTAQSELKSTQGGDLASAQDVRFSGKLYDHAISALWYQEEPVRGLQGAVGGWESLAEYRYVHAHHGLWGAVALGGGQDRHGLWGVASRVGAGVSRTLDLSWHNHSLNGYLAAEGQWARRAWSTEEIKLDLTAGLQAASVESYWQLLNSWGLHDAWGVGKVKWTVAVPIAATGLDRHLPIELPGQTRVAVGLGRTVWRQRAPVETVISFGFWHRF